MRNIATIVEGHGECEAVPLIIRRIASEVAPHEPIVVRPPIRTKRHRILKAGELERTVELAARQVAPDGGILILLDADQDCPFELAHGVLARARQTRADVRICSVVAKREFESWFVAAAESLAGRHGLPADLAAPADPEQVADPKRWISEAMLSSRKYRETVHQPAFAAIFDMNQARRASSFDKFWRDVSALLA